MIEYQHWSDKATGELFAVRLVDGMVTGACGPLYDEDRLPAERMAEYHYDDPLLADDLRGDEKNYDINS